MKTRQGFVSNSSSSSFVVAAPADEKKHFVTVVQDLNDIGTKISTEDEYYDFLRDEYESIEEALSDEYYGKTAKNILRALADGKVVFICSVSSEDYGNTLSPILYDTGGISEDDNPHLEQL